MGKRLDNDHLKELESLVYDKRNEANVKKIKKILHNWLPESFAISSIDNSWFGKNDDIIKEKLGQIDTPQWIAKLITKLCVKTTYEKVLDPCFGNGIFIEEIYEKLNQINKGKHFSFVDGIFGVELDPVQFARGLANVFKKHNRIDLANFYCGDIFDLKEKDFTSIVLNPPYTRQENLSDEDTNHLNKKIISNKILKTIDVPLSARSNLYSYFLIYLTSLLADGGRIGAIIPKGWLDSKYGILLQKFILSNFDLELVIDFEKDSFDKVIVEDCIIVMKKTKNNSRNKTKFIHIKSEIDVNQIEKKIRTKEDIENTVLNMVHVSKKRLLNDHKWGKFLQLPKKILDAYLNDKMVPLSTFADVKRGITTNWNDFFIINSQRLDELKIEKKFLTPIICSPRDVKRLDAANDTRMAYLLHIEEPLITNSQSKARKYVDKMSKNLKEGKGHSTIAKVIGDKANSWYIVHPSKPAPIIFSYIIRKMKNFIYNSNHYFTRDNFYNIYPKKVNPKLIYGILNSSIVRLNMELMGRRYGNGILKIQAYEMQDMHVPDLRIMPEFIIKKITDLADEMLSLKVNDPKIRKIVRQIDKEIDEYLKLDIKPENLIQIEQKLVNNRLGRRRSKVN